MSLAKKLIENFEKIELSEDNWTPVKLEQGKIVNPKEVTPYDRLGREFISQVARAMGLHEEDPDAIKEIEKQFSTKFDDQDKLMTFVKTVIQIPKMAAYKKENPNKEIDVA